MPARPGTVARATMLSPSVISSRLPSVARTQDVAFTVATATLHCGNGGMMTSTRVAASEIETPTGRVRAVSDGTAIVRITWIAPGTMAVPSLKIGRAHV